MDNNQKIKHYHKDIHGIVFGIFLNIMNFNFLYLQYILPALGAVLLFSGVKDLKEENKYFKLSYKLSIVNLILNLGTFIYVASPLYIEINRSFIFTIVSTVFNLCFILLIRRGIKEIFIINGLELKRDPILGVVIFRLTTLFIISIGLSAFWVTFILIILWYIYLFQSLIKFGYEMLEINYVPNINGRKIDRKIIIVGYLILCSLVTSVTCVVSNNISLTPKEFMYYDDTKERDILIKKGIPAAIINDISDEEIKLLKDTINVEVKSEYLYFDKSKEYMNSEVNETNSNNKLNSTTVFCQQKDNNFYTIVYFQWLEGNPYWGDGINISVAGYMEDVVGKLLYNKDNKNYIADIPNLQILSNDNINNNIYYNENEKLHGDINYPFGSENKKGYIFYKINTPQGYTIGSNIVNYIHYRHPFKIPYVDNMKDDKFINNNLRQQYTTYEVYKFNEGN